MFGKKKTLPEKRNASAAEAAPSANDTSTKLNINPVDFSSQSISRAVISKTATHPLTVFPLAVAVIGGAGCLLFGAAPIFIGAALGGLVVGLGTGVVNFCFRSDAIAEKYLLEMRERMHKASQAQIAGLGSDIRACRGIPGLDEWIEQSERQFVEIDEAFRTLQKILARQLQKGELTYSRFLGTAEQAVGAVLNTLQGAVLRMHSVRLIDEQVISRKIKQLSRYKQLSESDQREKSVLEGKLRLRQEQIEEINSMLDANDEAIVALERTIAEISRMKTGEQYGDTDLETAIAEMKNIAERANRMGRSS